MADKRAQDLEAKRQELIRLLEADDWRVTESARNAGYNLGFTECGLIEYILECLRTPARLQPIALGDPPGSGGTAYFMRKAGHKHLYIKLIVMDRRVLVMSFKH